MRTILIPLIISLLAVNACQQLYSYSFPDAELKQRFAPEVTKWEYSDNTVTSISVIGNDNKLYRLPVTPETKLEATTIYGEVCTFYLQKIKIEDAESFIGEGKSWTGYELHGHAERTIYTRDIKSIRILSPKQASQIIY